MEDEPEDDIDGEDDPFPDKNEGTGIVGETQLLLTLTMRTMRRMALGEQHHHNNNDEGNEDASNDESQGLHEASVDAHKEDKGAAEKSVAQEADLIVEDQGADEGAAMNEEEPVLIEDGGRYNLWPNQNRNYDHLYVDHKVSLCSVGCQKLATNLREAHCCFIGYVMTQMTVTAGIKKHIEAAIEALFKDLAQLKKGVSVALDASKLIRQQQRQALHAINLIKEKCNGAKKEGPARM